MCLKVAITWFKTMCVRMYASNKTIITFILGKALNTHRHKFYTSNLTYTLVSNSMGIIEPIYLFAYFAYCVLLQKKKSMVLKWGEKKCALILFIFMHFYLHLLTSIMCVSAYMRGFFLSTLPFLCLFNYFPLLFLSHSLYTT